MFEGLPLIVMAMEAESAPVREKLGLVGDGNKFGEGISARLWSNESVHLVTNGFDSRFGIDAIGTIPASLYYLIRLSENEPEHSYFCWDVWRIYFKERFHW